MDGTCSRIRQIATCSSLNDPVHRQASPVTTVVTVPGVVPKRKDVPCGNREVPALISHCCVVVGSEFIRRSEFLAVHHDLAFAEFDALTGHGSDSLNKYLPFAIRFLCHVDHLEKYDLSLMKFGQ